MHPRKSPGSSNVTTVSSTDAYVLPQVVEIASGTEGFVTTLFVRDRDEIWRGQDVLEVACEHARLDCGVACARIRRRWRDSDIVDTPRLRFDLLGTRTSQASSCTGRSCPSR